MEEQNVGQAGAAALKYVTYCGLYCRVCSAMSRIPEQAAALQETMRRDGYETFGAYCIEGFETFWKALEGLRAASETCPGCRSGACGDPNCAIRTCAEGRGVDVCATGCSDYPCELIRKLAELYPNLIGDGERLAKVGLERWIQDQEKRSTRGFCYADVRY